MRGSTTSSARRPIANAPQFCLRDVARRGLPERANHREIRQVGSGALCAVAQEATGESELQATTTRKTGDDIYPLK